MENRYIHIPWFLGGLSLIAYGIFVNITGKFLIHEESLTTILAYKDADPFSYYFNLLGSILLGSVYLYQSLLFIPWNKDMVKKQAEYDREIIGNQKKN